MTGLTVSGRWFEDAHGCKVLLRGINLGGSSKLPYGVVPPHLHESEGSFVGRPFPLEEADEHFARLQAWGFNCVRLLTTWEAIEREAPGKYDVEYLDYFEKLVERAGAYGLWVFIDPHQDVWSRWTGGDGAPRWTLERVGFNVENLDRSDAALTMGERFPHYEIMSWPNNWARLACSTMFTLFFAGDRFAPQVQVSGYSVQEFLQSHFIGALEQVAKRLAKYSHVLGYGTMNEPSKGYIGIDKLSDSLTVYNTAARLTGFESLYVPAGFSCEVPFVTRVGLQQVNTGTVVLNSKKHNAWQQADADIWRQNGVWDIDGSGNPRLLRDSYFAGVSFFAECVRPFALRYAHALHKIHPHSIVFIEGEPGAREPLNWSSGIPVVNASHWYDLLTLLTKKYDPEAALIWGEEGTVSGKEAVKDSFAQQIAALVADSEQNLSGAPTLVGEFGLPFDMHNGAGYASGDFSAQEQAMTCYFDALDSNLVHSALWNYTADNSNEWGDGWNGEDLSIFSRDQQENKADLNSGGRGVRGFCRPTMRAVAGIPKKQFFEMQSGLFEFEMDAFPTENKKSEFFVPHLQYPDGFTAAVTSGVCEYNAQSQILTWKNANSGKQKLTLERKGACGKL